MVALDLCCRLGANIKCVCVPVELLALSSFGKLTSVARLRSKMMDRLCAFQLPRKST
jgi:hypothetical protein